MNMLSKLRGCAVLMFGATLGVLAPAEPVQASGSGKPTVVFVHGFLGFCRDEALGYKYWGGFDDLQTQLDAQYTDMKVRTVCVGPVSSNYDRAVELFWKIKGGCIDYGTQHAAVHGHQRYFKNSTQTRNTADSRQCPRADAPLEKNRAVYTEWDASHPIHLISHSHGGQTARVLAQLLANNGRSPEGDTNLFAPYTVNASWVKSVTTLATPNDGTTLANVIVNYVPWVQTLVSELAIFIGFSPTFSNAVYDFKLDQWDVAQRGSSQGFLDYVDRSLNNSKRLFTDRSVRDISTYDLSPDGALRTNSWVTDVASVYYFSISTRATTSGWITGWRYPRLDANILIGAFCGPGFMGNFTRSAAPAIDSSWWDSDCVVNTRSQKAPTLMISPYNAANGTTPTLRSVAINDLSHGGTPQKGKWNWRGLVDGFDHFDITGWTVLQWSSSNKLAFYKQHIDLLRALP